MLSHILYGTSSLAFGGILLKARVAGPRGQQVSLEVAQGDQLDVSVTIESAGVGDISVTTPGGTTEQQLVNALQDSANFRKLASAEQFSGDGSDEAGTLPKTQFVAPTGGLKQWLESRLLIIGWDDRDQIATSSPRGLLWVGEAKAQLEAFDESGFDLWTGSLQATIAFQHNTPFEVQNALLDLYRRALYSTLKTFNHEDLVDVGPMTFGFGNSLKPEAADKTKEQAHLRLIAQSPIEWRERPFDFEDENNAPFDQALIGLFREPEDTEV
ncbi:MAG TPA: hypothetical protein VF747_11825, partial [Blastocatellia bacterium]